MEGVDVADPAERTRTLGHVLGVTVGGFLAANVLAVLAASIASGFGVTEAATPVSFYTLLYVMNYVGFILVSVWYLTSYDARSLLLLRRPKLKDVACVAVGLVSLYAVLLAISLVLSQFGIEAAQNTATERGERMPTLLLVLIPLSIFLNAPAEELLFRGVVQGLFRRAYGPLPAVLAASLVFGLAHFLALGGEGSITVTLGLLTALGMVLGAVYEYTESLLVPSLVHGLWNAYQFFTVYDRVEGVLWLVG